MLKLYDQNHNAVTNISKYRDLKVESDVTTGDKTLSFTLLEKGWNVQCEYYIDDGKDEYVVKEAPLGTDEFPQIVAVLNLEELEAKPWASFSVKDTTIDAAARQALAGTGWTVGECGVTKKRSAGMLQVTTKDIINNLCTAFMCERVYDTRKKTVSFYEKIGRDRGVYFLKGLNLRKLNRKSDTYDYCTRLIPIGADNLTIGKVNDGKNYLENYQYSDKVITAIWKDESYTDAQALKEDGELKLQDLSKPVTSYTADVVDLARQSTEYTVLSFRLGDYITLIDAETGTREKQRIVRMTEYPRQPEKNTCELANTVLTFEELQQKYQAAADIIHTVVSGDGRYTGKINVSDILHFEEGISGSSTVSGLQSGIDSLNGQMSELTLSIGTIEANYVKAEEADLKYATIGSLNATDAKIGSLQGDYGSFKSLVTDELAAHKGLIDDLTAGSITTDYLKANYADIALANVNNAWIENGIIKDGAIGTAAIHEGAITNAKIADATIEAAKIKSINADVIDAGTIRTERLIITGPDGQDSIVKAINLANGVSEADVNSQKIQVASIEVADLSAFRAKLAQFDVDMNAIYSGKTSIKDPHSGIYIATVGIGMGDGTLTGKGESPLQAYADGSFKLIGKNSKFDFDTVTGELNIEASSFTVSSKTVVTHDELEEVRDEVTTSLQIDSSRGIVFKNNYVSTVLSVIIYRGKQRITNADEMREAFGTGAYLQWYWQRLDDESFGVLSSGDPRFSDDGFRLTLSPDDVDTKVVFMCELIV